MTADTDVLVLAIVAVVKSDNKNLWVSLVVGDSHIVLPASILKKTIGYKKKFALPVFHTFASCDTISSSKSIGKKKT